jgi:hypothetical protein
MDIETARHQARQSRADDHSVDSLFYHVRAAQAAAARALEVGIVARRTGDATDWTLEATASLARDAARDAVDAVLSGAESAGECRDAAEAHANAAEAVLEANPATEEEATRIIIEVVAARLEAQNKDFNGDVL